MKFKTLNGREKYKNISKYKIKWDGPSRSKFQKSVKEFLKKYWQHDIVFEEAPILGTRLQVDILNVTRKVAVEIDGVQHNKFNKFFHSTPNNYRRQIERDLQKEEWLDLNSFKLVRINPEDEISKEWFEEKFNVTL